MELLPIDWFEADFYRSKVARKGMTVCVFNTYIRSADDLDDLEQDEQNLTDLWTLCIVIVACALIARIAFQIVKKRMQKSN